MRSEPLQLRWRLDLPEDWETWLPSAIGASFAARSGWLESFPHFDVSSKLHVLTARRADRLVAALPLVTSRRWGSVWARSSPFGTYGGPLLSRDELQPEEVHRALADAYARWAPEHRVAGGELVYAPFGAADGTLPEWRRHFQSSTEGATHVVDLSAGWEAIHAGLKRETRKGLRRAERLGVYFAEEPDRLEAVYDLHLEQSEQWPGHRAYPLNFLRTLLEHPTRFARLHVAKVEDRIVAGVLAMEGGEETFLWWSGAGGESRQTLAFPALLLHVLSVACRDGRKRFNIGSSAGRENLERFKESLGAEPQPIWVHHLRAAHSSPWLRILNWVRARRRRV